MGTTIKYENIDIQHPLYFLNVFVHQYIWDPLYTFFIVVLIKPPIHQVYGMFIATLTPATVAASVTTYTVNGDVPLAVAMSIASLLQSIILTPILFSIMVKMYVRTLKKDGDEKIVMPYLRMFGLMMYVIVLIGTGFFFRRNIRASIVNPTARYLQRATIFFMLIAFGCFFASSVFIKAITPSNPLSYFGSIIILTYGPLVSAYFPTYMMKSVKKKDSIILVITRRSPGISLAIATLSFQNTDHYGSVVGYILVFGMIRDWAFMPFLMYLRKKRLGHFFFSKDNHPESNAVIEDDTRV
tara:strand:- start:1797 stop:2690 length:894 start_codon:yes stop_codon:yes gene_type:complete